MPGRTGGFGSLSGHRALPSPSIRLVDRDCCRARAHAGCCLQLQQNRPDAGVFKDGLVRRTDGHAQLEPAPSQPGLLMVGRNFDAAVLRLSFVAQTLLQDAAWDCGRGAPVAGMKTSGWVVLRFSRWSL